MSERQGQHAGSTLGKLSSETQILVLKPEPGGLATGTLRLVT